MRQMCARIAAILRRGSGGSGTNGALSRSRLLPPQWPSPGACGDRGVSPAHRLLDGNSIPVRFLRTFDRRPTVARLVLSFCLSNDCSN